MFGDLISGVMVMAKADRISDATLAGMLEKHLSKGPTVKDLAGISPTTRSALEAWAVSENELPGSFDPPKWLAGWIRAHQAERLVEPYESAPPEADPPDGLTDEIFSRDEMPPEEDEPDGAIAQGLGSVIAGTAEELREALADEVSMAWTVADAKAAIIGGAEDAAECEGLAGAIWRVRQAVVATDYIEGEQRSVDEERGFTYKATRDAFEQLRILWAAEGLHVVPVAEDASLTRFQALDSKAGRNSAVQDPAFGSVCVRVQWVIEYLPTGERSEPIATSGVAVGRLDEAFQSAKTVARKQMLCDAFGVQIHTESHDTEKRR